MSTTCLFSVGLSSEGQATRRLSPTTLAEFALIGRAGDMLTQVNSSRRHCKLSLHHLGPATAVPCLLSRIESREHHIAEHTQGLDAASCVGIDMWHEHRSLILHFDDAYERDKFYTSLQVLKMSIDIQQAR